MIALLRVFLRFAVRFSSRYEVVVLYVILYYYVGFSYEIAKQDFYYCFLLASRSNKKSQRIDDLRQLLLRLDSLRFCLV